MPRFYDELLAHGYQVSSPADAYLYQAKGCMQHLENATVVVCDNVDAYWERVGSKSFTKDLEKAIPKVVAPISPCFMEARVSNPRARMDLLSYGALGVMYDLNTDKGRAALAYPIFDRNQGFSWQGDRVPDLRDSDISDTRFLAEWWMFFKLNPASPIVTRNKQPLLMGLYCQPCREDGSPIVDRPHALRRTVCFAPGAIAKEATAALTAGMGMLLKLYLAVSFMHCKNVGVREKAPAFIENGPWRKKHKRPLVTYRVLDIDPMRETLRTEGGAEKDGLERALHICRGHFATYTEDAPLFGRVTGTFWKPQHVRGAAKHGAVVKDYNVETP